MKYFLTGILVGLVPFAFALGYIERGHFGAGAEAVVILCAIGAACSVYGDYKINRRKGNENNKNSH